MVTTTWRDEYQARVKAPCRADVPLAPLTTFRIGGAADLVVEPRSEADAVEAVAVAAELAVPVTLLGGGSNVLVADRGVRGIVLRLAGRLSQVLVTDDGRRVDVGAGAPFPRLTKVCMALGWERSDGWVGTPGTVGGALVMNAGSREGEIGEVVESVRLIVDGHATTFIRAQCGFEYRKSAFPRGALILSAVLRCDSADPARAAYVEERGHQALLRRKRSQPREHSAGSIFKNPPGGSAGKLIEETGLKGARQGGAVISPVHANFIVNTGGATAADVVALAELARTRVRERTSVELEWEVRRIGEFQ
ncbi:MAG: UDP-N-acetylmuramate dehydrogenase [Deltaproteobacteria bacterium]|nr:UDP-N-acetylmuramate dehydrogenase [Deltaproteobacteria bacterium]